MKKDAVNVYEDIDGLEQMKESMLQSIDSASRVIAQQKSLIEIVKSSDKAEEFEEFIKELSAQNDNLVEQIAILKRRAANFVELKEWFEQNKEVNCKPIHNLITFLGVFDSIQK